MGSRLHCDYAAVVRMEVYSDAAEVARAGAAIIATEIRAAVAARGRFVMAVSGGRTPWLMLRALTATENVPWKAVHVVQVDERMAPPGHPERNLTHIAEILLGPAVLDGSQVTSMPVEYADLSAGAKAYAETLAQVGGSPPVLDLVHLGLGSDGHTASLLPGDPVLEARADVAVTRPYQGRRRMTLTYPILNRARSILWVVTGSDKTEALARLRDADRSIPAGHVCADHALVLADRTAGGARGPKY
jgi:6-phosphogluconolactonase